MNTQLSLFINRSTRCSICGKPLRGKLSQARGIGPTCWAEQLSQLEHEECQSSFIDIPLCHGVRFFRKDGRVITNVERLFWHYSPAGFDFRNTEPGALDLSLNLSQIVLLREGFKGKNIRTHENKNCLEAAWFVHEDVCMMFVSQVESVTIIPYQEVSEFILSNIPSFLEKQDV